MNTSTIQRTLSRVYRSEDPLPFSDELEPCVFYRITPIISPIIGIVLIALSVIAAIGGLITGTTISWFAVVAGIAAGALCIGLPRMAGRLPGSDWLTALEIRFERRMNSAERAES